MQAACSVDASQVCSELARRAALNAKQDFCDLAKVKPEACRHIGWGACRLWLGLLVRSPGMRAS